MKYNDISQIKDFNTLDKLKQIYKEQFENKYDFDLYIAPSQEKLKKKFELLFSELDQPYEKLFDNTLLKEVFPKSYTSIALALYVYLGEEQKDVLFSQTLEEFLSTSVLINRIGK